MQGFVIGDREMITGFKLVGVEGVQVNDIEEAKQAFSKALTRSDIAVLIISEEFSTKLHEKINKERLAHVTPLIVEAPSHFGPTGEIRISDLITKTLGIKV